VVILKGTEILSKNPMLNQAVVILKGTEILSNTKANIRAQITETLFNLPKVKIRPRAYLATMELTDSLTFLMLMSKTFE